MTKGSKVFNIAITVVAIAMAIYQLASVLWPMVDPTQHQNIHLGFAVTILSLIALRDKQNWWYRAFIVILLAGTLAAVGYVHLNFVELQARGGYPLLPDVVFGMVLIIICIELTRRAFGLVFPLLVLIFIAYGFFGPRFPEPFHAFAYRPDTFVYNMTTSLSDGIYGTYMSISANYMFLFVFFGSLFANLGATSFFQEVGKLLGRKLRGGAALSSVVTSAMVGTLTGSVTANVITTGSFTIPTMKRAGYMPHQAGAIEATASTGGAIMPPIMGAAAFVMSGVTGIPYLKICVMATLPAILYFLTAGLYAQLQAMRMKITPVYSKIDYREMFLSAPEFVIPLTVIIILLVQGRSLMFVIFWTLVALITMTLIRKKTRPPLKQYVEAFAKGATFGAEIAVVSACVGIVVGIIIMTGLGIKLPAAVEAASGGRIAIALILTMIVAVILGMGMTAVAAYSLVAIAAAPALLRMGVRLEQAHLFVFYFACISYVTPPVALGSLVASKIAEANYTKTALEATKVAVGGFLVPFFMFLTPIIIMMPQPPLLAIAGIVSCLLVLTSFQIAFCGQYLLTLNPLERVIAAINGVLILLYLVTKSPWLFGIGLIIFIALTLWQLQRRRVASQLAV